VLEDWSYHKPVVCIRDNKPGWLYKVASLMGDNQLDILKATNQINDNVSFIMNYFEFEIRCKKREIPLDVKRRLANVKYSDSHNNTVIKFNHLKEIRKEQPSEQMLIIEGRNRVGLLADIAYFPFHKNYNILVSNSSIVEENNPMKFSIGFVFDTYLEEQQQQELINKINQHSVMDNFKINFCTHSMIFNK
jgi:uncharacterized protein with ACT and thioredoxin-like domain